LIRAKRGLASPWSKFYYSQTEQSALMTREIYYGDNLEILRKYVRDESVALCYIDPPFNSKRTYNQIYNNLGEEDTAQVEAFVDTWNWDDSANAGFTEILSNQEGRFNSQTVDLINGLQAVLGKGSILAYLVSIALCAVEIRRVLKTDGSFYLHCDPTASHYLKVLLDTIFCLVAVTFKMRLFGTMLQEERQRAGMRENMTSFYSIQRVIPSCSTQMLSESQEPRSL
jgi:hypothetical protein